MSTFKGLIPEIEGISVDQFQGDNYKSRVFFLSHCHSDHMKGLDTQKFYDYLVDKKYSIYVSEVSAIILSDTRLTSYVKALNTEEAHTILIPRSPNSEEKSISVSLIPTDHCPGSVMFLFKTPDKVILYTGDFRVDPESLSTIKHLNVSGKPLPIDKMYFDSTFWKEDFPYFPSREESCGTIINLINEWISKGEEYIINIHFPNYYGLEMLYKDVKNKLDWSTHVNETVVGPYGKMKDMEGVYTKNPMETQIHSCTKIKGVRQLACRDITGLKIRQIKLTAQIWSNMREGGPISRNFGHEEFRVCYSSHSGFNELKEFIQHLKPKAIEPCVVPGGPKDIEGKEKFYESINLFDFLEVPCKMPLNSNSAAD